MHTLLANPKVLLNSCGILLTMIGVCVVYANSPINSFGIDGGNASTDFKEIEKITHQKNRYMRRGVYVVLLGSALQVVSNYVA